LRSKRGGCGWPTGKLRVFSEERSKTAEHEKEEKPVWFPNSYWRIRLCIKSSREKLEMQEESGEPFPQYSCKRAQLKGEEESLSGGGIWRRGVERNEM